jgi:chromosome segregation ATPase
MILLVPSHAAGEVATITELKEKLENISEEEKAVLTELFAIEQDISTLEADEKKLAAEIERLQESIRKLTASIEEKQRSYDKQLDILKQVLVNYQRRGPASYLEIILQAKDLSSFIKSLNILKDISHNTNELLTELKEGKTELEEKKSSLEAENTLLGQKLDKLAEDLKMKQQLQKQMEDYLTALQQDSDTYSKQLELVAGMWEDCTRLFPEISEEIKEIIEAGYLTLEDLHIRLGFFNMSGYIDEETFNKVLADNSKLTQTIFKFEDGRVVIDVPQERLLLRGNFIITGKSAVSFVADEGYFYDLPLEQTSIDELFVNEGLTIDFERIADDVITIDFKITDVGSEEGRLSFVIVPQF